MSTPKIAHTPSTTARAAPSATLLRAALAVALAAMLLAELTPTGALTLAAQTVPSPPAVASEASPPAAADVAGRWEGRLEVGDATVRIVFRIRPSGDGGWTATLDSPDQGAVGIPVETVTVDGDSLRLDLRAVRAVYAGRVADEGAAIDGEWRQAGRSLPLRVERAEEDGSGQADDAPRTRRPQDPEPPHPYAEVEVEIEVPGADVTLAGTLVLPPVDGPVPAVVLVSGSGPQDRDEALAGHRPFLVLADHLARRGVAVLRTDDRGVGGSTGSTFGSTLEDRADDLIAAVRFLRERPGIDRNRVGALGHSEGGWVVSVAAASVPDEIAFVVLLAGPGQSPRELLRSQQRALLGAQGASEAMIAARGAFVDGNFDIILAAPDTVTARARLLERRGEILQELPGAQRRALEAYFEEQTDAARDQALWIAATPWFRDLLAFDAAPSLRAMDQPALALLAAADVQVPADENEPLLKRMLDADGRDDREVRVLPGLNHLFQPSETGLPTEYATIDTTMSVAALEAVGDWIEHRVGR